MHPRQQRQTAGASLGAGGIPAAWAFSLLELLIVVAIIMVLFVMLYGSGSRSAQTRNKAACQKNLQTLHLALQIYANDFNGLFPMSSGAQFSEQVLSSLVPKYTSITEPFICPGSPDARLPEAEPFAERKISYAYYMGRRATNASDALVTDRQVDASAKTRGAPLFSRDGQGPGSNHNKYGGNVLFGDGHVERAPPAAPFALPLGPGVALLNPRP